MQQLDDPHQCSIRGALLHQGIRTRLPCPLLAHGIAVSCQDDDLHRQPFIADTPGRLQPIQVWHMQVHENNIRLELLCQIDRFEAIGCRPHNLQVTLKLQEGLQPFAHVDLVIDDKQTYSITHRVRCFSR